MLLSAWSWEKQELINIPNTFMAESSQHYKSREKKVCCKQVRAILQSKLYTVVDEDQENVGTYTGECMRGFTHGEGSIKFYTGNELESVSYLDSRFGRYLFEFNIFS